MEDYFGGMDFKIVGSKSGITALQLDVKVSYITTNLLQQSLNDAREGRLAILEKMVTAVKTRAASLKKSDRLSKKYLPGYAVPREKIRDYGALFGKKGETLKRIKRETGAEVIDLEDVIDKEIVSKAFVYAGLKAVAETQRRKYT